MSSTLSLRAPEVRTYAAMEFRALSVGETLTQLDGLAVPYNEWANIGWYAEQIAPGAFDRSITQAARGLPLLLWHDSQTWPIGAAVDWKSTRAGLSGSWQLDESEEAQRGAQLARDGMLTGLSVGFVPIQSAWDYVSDTEWNPDAGVEHMDRVTRTEARLVEVSLTPTPAFAGAGVTLVRSSSKRDRTRPPVNSHELRVWRDYLREHARG